MVPNICNDGGPDAADDTEEEPHRLDVYETDVPRDDSVASERKHRIVVQIHGHDYALGHSSQLELQSAAWSDPLFAVGKDVSSLARLVPLLLLLHQIYNIP